MFPYSDNNWETLSVKLYIEGTGWVTKTVNYSMVGEWHHLTMTYDNISTTSDNLSIYIDGELADSWVQTGEIRSNTLPIYLGTKSTPCSGYAKLICKLRGYLDEAVIYDRALSPEDIKNSYGTLLDSAVAYDASTHGNGIQTGDQVVIRFSGETNSLAIDNSNIDSVLFLSNGHSWLDSGGNLGSVTWSSIYTNNDTLTVNLIASNGVPTVVPRDLITLNQTIGSKIIDKNNNPIMDTVGIEGSFGFIPESAVMYLKLDENGNDPLTNDGFDFYDDTMKNNHGYLGVNPEDSPCRSDPAWVAGRVGTSALSFNQSAYPYNHAVVPNSESLNLSDAITIQAWISGEPSEFYGIPMQQHVVSKAGVASGYVFPFSTDNWQNLGAYLYLDTEGWVREDIVYNKVAEWHHLTMTYDSNISSNNLKIYMDGELSQSWNHTGKIVTNSLPINLGARPEGCTGDKIVCRFDGMLDEVIIYSRAITAAEVKSSYGSWLDTAVAEDSSGNGDGIQVQDKVVINFISETNGLAIDNTNIDSVLSLNNNHSWLDGNGQIYTTIWSQRDYPNDTLTVVLSDTNGAPSVAVRDIITLNQTSGFKIIGMGEPIMDSVVINGTFGVAYAGLVGHWRLDEGGNDPNPIDGFDFYDESPNNNHGYLGEAPGGTRSDPAWIAGKVGSHALDFNGMDYPFHFTNIPDSDSLDLTDKLTIQAWVYGKPATYKGVPHGQHVISKDAGNSGYVFPYTDDNWATLSARLYLENEGWVQINVPYNKPNEWHHMALTYDSTVVGTKNLKIYIDGELVNSWEKNNPVVPNSTELKFGIRPVDWTCGYNWRCTFNGSLDEVFIFSKALSDAEIKDFYGSSLLSATAFDTGINPGVQIGDTVVFSFSGTTNGYPIDSSNIDSVLQLSNSHSWLDSSGNISSVVWDSVINTNDRLTVTLSGAAVKVSKATIYLEGGNVSAADASNYSATLTKIPNDDLNLLGLWHMDEGSGQIQDSSGNNNASDYNTAAWQGNDGGKWDSVDQQFISGDHLGFSGAKNKYVGIPDSSSLHFGVDSFGVVSWLKATSFSSFDAPDYIRWFAKSGYCRSWQTSPACTWIAGQINSDGSVEVWGRGYADANLFSIRTPPGVITLNEWYHVAVVFDRNASKGFIYVNGVNQSGAGADISNLTGSLDVSGKPLTLSADWGEFRGNMDEAAIYKGVLSEEKIKALYYRRRFADPQPTWQIGVQESSLLTSWSSRWPVTITENTGTMLFSHQVGEIDIQGNNPAQPNYVDFNVFNTDCSDVRFTDSNGLTFLPFWRRSWDNVGKTAKLWVLVPVMGSKAMVATGDIVTLDGSIKDVLGRSMVDSVIISGTFGSLAPYTPVNVSPPDGIFDVPIAPSLESSAFSDPDVTDLHQASEWQIASNAAFTTIVYDSGVTTDLVSHTISSSLLYSTQYYWRVRHQDNQTYWSDYSVPTSFTTTAFGMAAHWMFDETIGSTASDDTANNNDGVLMGQLELIEACDNVTGWDGNLGSLSLNTTTYNQGTGALNLIKTSASSADSRYWKNIATTNKMTDKIINIMLYIKDAATLAKIQRVQITLHDSYLGGTGGWAWEIGKNIDHVDVVEGWQVLSFDVNNPDYTSGTPDLNAVGAIRLDVDTYNIGATYAAGDVVMDSWFVGNSSSGPNWVTGRYNNALSFNGISSRHSVRVANSDTLNIQGDFTIEGWIKTASPLEAGYIFYKYDDNSPYGGYGLRLNADGTLSARIGAAWYTSSLTVTAGVWTHVGVAVLGNTLTFYVNAVADTPVVVSPVGSWVGNAYIGSGEDTGFFHGVMDELAVYDRGLTGVEITTRYNMPPIP